MAENSIPESIRTQLTPEQTARVLDLCQRHEQSGESAVEDLNFLLDSSRRGGAR